MLVLKLIHVNKMATGWLLRYARQMFGMPVDALIEFDKYVEVMTLQMDQNFRFNFPIKYLFAYLPFLICLS